MSAGVYKVTAIRDRGFRYESTGLDPDKLLEEAIIWAKKSKMKQTAKSGAIFDWLTMLEAARRTDQIYQIAVGFFTGAG